MTEPAIPGNAAGRAAIARPAIALFVAGPRIRRRGWHAADGVSRAVLDPPPRAGPP